MTYKGVMTLYSLSHTSLFSIWTISVNTDWCDYKNTGKSEWYINSGLAYWWFTQLSEILIPWVEQFSFSSSQLSLHPNSCCIPLYVIYILVVLNTSIYMSLLFSFHRSHWCVELMYTNTKINVWACDYCPPWWIKWRMLLWEAGWNGVEKYILSEHIVMGHILKWNTQKANTQVHCKTGSKRKRRERKKRERNEQCAVSTLPQNPMSSSSE